MLDLSVKKLRGLTESGPEHEFDIDISHNLWEQIQSLTETVDKLTKENNRIKNQNKTLKSKLKQANKSTYPFPKLPEMRTVKHG